MIDLHENARGKFAYYVSEKAARDELRVQRMLGAEWTEAYLNAWQIADQVAQLVYAEDRPAVHLPVRYVRKPR